ncbi:MAG: hypothetical protein ACI35S_07995 [Anaeroplasma sp.]
MNKIYINIKEIKRMYSPLTIMINEEEVKFNKRKDYYEIEYETEKEYIDLSIQRYLEINGKHWLIMAIIFFIISIFGIFCPSYDKKCLRIDFKYKIYLKEQNSIDIIFDKMIKNKIIIETNLETNELSNEIYIDFKAKKRLRILFVLRIMFWLLFIVLSILFIIKYIW